MTLSNDALFARIEEALAKASAAEIQLLLADLGSGELFELARHVASDKSAELDVQEAMAQSKKVAVLAQEVAKRASRRSRDLCNRSNQITRAVRDIPFKRHVS